MTIDTDHIALEIQTRLLQNFIGLVRSSEAGTLRATLQKTVDLAAEITGAEAGSLFLLDSGGGVTDCIMIGAAGTCEENADLIGSVMAHGLAGWVARHRQVGLVTDTRRDERWLTLPCQPYTARSALVIPILKGENLFGILSLVHAEPDRFDNRTASLMTIAAEPMAIVLENAKLYDTLNEAFHKIEIAKNTIETYSNALVTELEKGRHMQRSFLPGVLPEIPGWRIEAYFHPAQQVSGDFYDVFAIDDRHLGIIIADVCDKGVSAALFMGIFRSLIHAYLEKAYEWDRELPQPEKAQRALVFLNAFILKHHGSEGIFATLFFGILDIRDGRLDYINAGHEPLLIVGVEGRGRELRPTGPAIGLSPEARFRLESVLLRSGETLVGFTDGITEAGGASGVRFGRSGVMEALRGPDAPADWMGAIVAAVFRHLDRGEVTDDIAMISIRRTTG